MVKPKGGDRQILGNNLRSRVLRVADELERQGSGLLEWAKENPGLFWTVLFKAVIPKEVNMEATVNVGLAERLAKALDINDMPEF